MALHRRRYGIATTVKAHTGLQRLKVDWLLDPIRNDAQFKAILVKMNFPP